jgi:hypothetical protein
MKKNNPKCFAKVNTFQKVYFIHKNKNGQMRKDIFFHNKNNQKIDETI